MSRSEKDIKKSIEHADKLTEKIRKKNKKEYNAKAFLGCGLFMVYAGCVGVGIYIVYLVIQALLKYIGG